MVRRQANLKINTNSRFIMAHMRSVLMYFVFFRDAASSVVSFVSFDAWSEGLLAYDV